MRRCGAWLIGVLLVIGVTGCGYQYKLLRDSDFSNPPPKGEMIRVTLQGFPRAVENELTQDDVEVYYDLYGPRLVEQNYRPVRNPFKVVASGGDPQLRIEGQRRTEDIPQRAVIDFEAPKRRQIAFRVTATEIVTGKVLYDEEVKKVFPRDRRYDRELITKVFLAMILDRLPV
jgi:hypothetical protein